jgi:hypothetical protein
VRPLKIGTEAAHKLYFLVSRCRRHRRQFLRETLRLYVERLSVRFS